MALWLGLFTVSFNIHVMTVLIVPITRAFGANVGSIQNVLVLITLVMAIFVPISQNLSNIYGHRKIFVLGQVAFATGLVIAALSPDVLTLTFGYGILAGLGSTPIVTLPWTITNEGFRERGRKRELAFLALGMAIATGSTVGPFLAGFLTTASDWRWAFVPQVVLMALIFLLARPVDDIVRAPSRRVDVAGGLLSFLGLAAVFVGINSANEYGWWSSKKEFYFLDRVSIAPLLIVSGVIMLLVFSFYWRRMTKAQHKVSVWRFALFRQRLFAAGVATNALYTIATAGLIYSLYLFLQVVHDLTPFDTALVVSPYYLAILLVLGVTTRFGRPFGPRAVIRTGLLLLMAGLWPLTTAVEAGFVTPQLVSGLVIMGIGAGFVISELAQLTHSNADLNSYGESSGIFNTIQDLGYSLGITIFGATLIYLASAAAVSGVVQQLQIPMAEAELQSIIADFEVALQILSETELQNSLRQLPDDVQKALADVAKNAEIQAMQMTLRGVALVLFMALAVSLFLPSVKEDRQC